MNGGWGEWSGFGECTQSCGGGVRTRSKNCDSPVKSESGLDCVGTWGSWDTWSQCSAECGTGTRTRSRRYDSPEPTAVGNDCEGESDKNENCNFHTCIGNHCCCCCCCCLFVCLFMYPIYSSSAWGMGRVDQLDPVFRDLWRRYD